MEPFTSGSGECSSAGGIQEKIGQLSIRCALVWIPALSREGVGLNGLIGPFHINDSMIHDFYL